MNDRETKRYIGERNLVITITVFALMIRIAWVLLAPRYDPILREDNLYGDAKGYHLLAVNLLKGYGLSWDRENATSLRAPGYPAFLAMSYQITGINPAAIRLIQAGLGALTCIPVFMITIYLAGRLVATLAALGVAVHPLLIYMTAWLYSETLFILLFWLAFWMLILLYRTKQISYALLCGVLLGLTSLIRPEVLAFPLVCIAFGIVLRQKRTLLVSLALIQTVCLLVVSPWTVRNYGVHGAFVPIATDGGVNLYGSNNPNADGGFVYDGLYVLSGMSEVESDRHLAKRAIDWIADNPLDFIRLWPLKISKFISPLEMGATGRFQTELSFLIYAIYGIYLFIAFASVVLLTRDRFAHHQRTEGMYFLVALIAYYFVMTIVFSGGTRFSLPIAPSLIILAAYTGVWGGEFFVRLVSGVSRSRKADSQIDV